MRTFRSQVLIAGFLAALTCVPSFAAADEVPTESKKEQARLHFTAGVNLLRDPGKPRYDEAYTEFKRAYALVASYKILGNIAFCAMKLERDAEAISGYTRYLEEAVDIDPEERAQVERDLTTLKVTHARFAVESHPDGAMLQDTRVVAQGESFTNVYGPLRGRTELGVRRGHHIFKARFPDGAELVWESDVNGGEEHVFERPALPAAVDAPPVAQPAAPAAPAAPPSRPIPTSVFIVGGTTVALAAGMVVTGLVATGTKSRYDDANGTNPARAEDLRSEGQTLNVVSDVLLVGALVGAAATTYLYLTRPSARALTTGLVVSPFGVAGRF